MATYKNFFETIEEALMRLKATVVMYDGKPYYIWTICNHKNDGVFRVYMSSIEDVNSGASPPPLHQFPHGTSQLGAAMDSYVDGANSTNSKILRKKMDSPLFNKFRPFPLGMMNCAGQAVYVERTPNRPKTEQGLISNQLRATAVTAAMNPGNYNVQFWSTEFRDCIMGDYPTPNQSISGIVSDKNVNESVAFHRNFALVKGPIGTLFLAYKNDVVGLLPQQNFSSIKLGKEFTHLKEAIKELNLFSSIM